jgi:glycosyltransferase involved in cell wall biosynthesis
MKNNIMNPEDPRKSASDRIKVLVSAYACEPHKGSEPGVGWNWAKQIAKFAEVWVVTRANNRDVIEAELMKNPDLNLHFCYNDIPRWLGFWKKKASGLYLYYLLWQLEAYRIAKIMHKQIKFDVVHQLTFGNLLLPTFMPFLKIPFIWGPIGGGEQVPESFTKQFDLKSKIKEILRNTILNMLKVNLFFLYTSKKAHIIMAKTKETANKIPNSKRNKVIITTDVAASPSDIQLLNKASDNLKIIAVGRLDAWRGFDLLIKAFSRIKDKQYIKLLILGEGNYRRKLEKITKNLNLNDSVIFAGQVKREEYFEYLSSSSIFVNPNLKEGGVTVLFDALYFGLPVICLDIPGSSEIVTNECGIKIKPDNPEQTIKDLSEALLKLANDPELRRQMGEAGKRRVEEFYTWEKKGEFIRKVYEDVLTHEDSSRP